MVNVQIASQPACQMCLASLHPIPGPVPLVQNKRQAMPWINVAECKS